MARRSPQQTNMRFEGDPWSAPVIRTAIKDHAAAEADRLQERLDDYVNRLTGIGDYLQDKALGGSAYGLGYRLRYMSNIDAEDRWRGSDLGARIIEAIPSEMMREGWDLAFQPSDEDEEKQDAFSAPGQPPMLPPEPKVPKPIEVDDEGAKLTEEFNGKLEELRASDALLTALQYERAYGGGAVLIGANDGMEDLTKPLVEESIASIDWLNVFQGGREGECVAWSYYSDPRSPKYGEPEIYMIRNIGVPLMSSAPGATMKPSNAKPIYWVHESRLLTFSGTAVSRRARVECRGWGDSIFTRIDEVLGQYSQTWGGIANLMTDFKQDVLMVQGNAEKIAADRKSKGNPLVARARLIQQTKSIARMLVIDKEGEDFKRETVQVAGVSEVLQQFALRLAAAADMPVTLLMGQAPAGLSATGASDIRFFYDRVASWQRRRIVPALQRLVKLLSLAKDGPTGGTEPGRWTVKMRPLYQLDALQEAQRRKAIADTDAIYITQGVLSPEEVAASRFGGSEFSGETTIDLEGREEAAEIQEREAEERKKQAEEMAKQAASAAPAAKPEAPAEKPAPAPVPVPAAKEEPSKADELATVAGALKELREAGAVVDNEKLKAQFPDLPVKAIIEDE